MPPLPLPLHLSTPPSSPPKTFLITGGSNGIGLAITKHLLQQPQNHSVIIADLHPPSPTSLPASISSNSNLLYTHCDVTSFPSILFAFSRAISWRGSIDVLIANAGIGEVEDLFLDDVDEEGVLVEPRHDVLKVNLLGVINCVKVAVHYMKKQVGGGHVVLMASSAGYVAEPCLAAYSAGKHGLIGFMRSLRLTAPRFNIHVNCIAPYMTESNLMRPEMRNKLNDLGVPINKPENVALAVEYVINNKLNGKTILSAANKFYEIEEDLTRLEAQYMGGIGELIRASQGAELFVSQSKL